MPTESSAPIVDGPIGVEPDAAQPLVAAIDDTVDAQRALEQHLRSALGVNNTDFRALMLVHRLRRRGIPVHPGDLTRGLGLSSGTSAQIISRLVTAGLLHRTHDPDDGRAGLLELTDRAAGHIADITRDLQHDLDQILETITPDENDRILELLRQIQRAFTAHAS